MPPIEIHLTQLASVLDYLLAWVGLGSVIGLIASAMLAGRRAAGSTVTVVVAVIGTLLGCGMLQYTDPGSDIRPMSHQGLVVGITGAVVLLMFFSLLGGFYTSHPAVEGQRARRRRLARQRLHFD